ncbi:hypothetical protein [Streptomyces sp. NPDC058424]|uniref:hypothetical protein n=1 Tax=Streptomyces sp. NPDC058424 TaxID=3346491 RepID=UPI0036561FCC
MSEIGVRGLYRALAEHAKREAYPEAVEAAHADFAALQAGGLPSPRPARVLTAEERVNPVNLLVNGPQAGT